MKSFAQFAIVHDKDGFLNVREKGNIHSKVINKLQNGHLIYCFEGDSNWTHIHFTANGKEREGYVYKGRYKMTSNFASIDKTSESANSIRFKKGAIEVNLSSSKFDKNKHKIKYYKDYPSQIELIDNKQYWGKDGGLPTSEYKNITIRKGKTKLALPQVAFNDLYEPTLYNSEVLYDEANEIIYIQTMNSDGAGTYYVIWKIEKGVYKGRLVAYNF
jgi:hypothetical protein